VDTEKSDLRSFYKTRVKDVNPENKIQQSHKICEKLQFYLRNKKGVWTLFAPLDDEPNLTSLLEVCPHIEWAFPRVTSKTQMRFYKAKNMGEFLTSPMGLGEPQDIKGTEVTSEQITGCIIPGLAFDSQGNRLGRGGGYYDRFLLNFKGPKLGVAFDESITKKWLPSESHDQKLDIVVSPREWIEVDQSEVNHG
jgi:5-formyltetrahydrofolate cyclo-ligase